MNCKHLAKILPELVSGELNEHVAREACDHIEECQSCAAEYDSYREAFDALSGPRPLVDVPDSLRVLRLPVKQHRLRLRINPAMVAVAVAAVIISIGVILHLGPAQRINVVAEKPVIRKEHRVMVERPQKKTVMEDPDEEIADRGIRLVQKQPQKQLTERKRFIAYHPQIERNEEDKQRQINTPKQSGAPNVEVDEPKPENTAALPPKEPENKNASIAVVASWVEPKTPYKMEIEVKDTASGTVSIHTETGDEMGQKQSTEIKSNIDTTTDGRVNL